MEPTEFIWLNGEFLPWDESKVHVLTHTLHYGGGAFEGIRVYKTTRGPAVFRLLEHMERLHYSMSALDMQIKWSAADLSELTCELLKKNKLEQGYIRPLVYFAYGIMGLNPRKSEVHAAIACWPWGAYLPHEAIDVRVSKYIRIHPRSTIADAKLCGHYLNSMLAALELKNTKYHEALFLDADGFVAEGPGENFFIVKNGELITPPTGTILPGLTRKTIMELARDLGLKVHEGALTLDQALSADEAFFTGTAAEVTPIRSINDKTLGSAAPGPITSKLKEKYLDVVYGRSPEYDRFLTFIA